jgi:hypothetical protein
MHEVGISAGSASPAQIQMARTPDAEIALIERVCSGETQLFYELISPMNVVSMWRPLQYCKMKRTPRKLSGDPVSTSTNSVHCFRHPDVGN